MRLILTFLAAAAMALPASAQQPLAVENDLRCIAVISAIIGNLPEGEQRTQVAAGVMYFVGHVEGLAPAVDLKIELKRLIPTITGEVIQSEAQRCSTVLMEKGTMLQAVGAELQGSD